MLELVVKVPRAVVRCIFGRPAEARRIELGALSNAELDEVLRR